MSGRDVSRDIIGGRAVSSINPINMVRGLLRGGIFETDEARR